MQLVKTTSLILKRIIFILFPISELLWLHLNSILHCIMLLQIYQSQWILLFLPCRSYWLDSSGSFWCSHLWLWNKMFAMYVERSRILSCVCAHARIFMLRYLSCLILFLCEKLVLSFFSGLFVGLSRHEIFSFFYVLHC